MISTPNVKRLCDKTNKTPFLKDKTNTPLLKQKVKKSVVNVKEPEYMPPKPISLEETLFELDLDWILNKRPSANAETPEFDLGMEFLDEVSVSSFEDFSHVEMLPMFVD